MSANTPGPWDITWGPVIKIGNDVAEVPQRLDGQHTANARLIAAAPDLLEFAREVRRSGDTRLASMAIAVIAKATGAAAPKEGEA